MKLRTLLLVVAGTFVFVGGWIVGAVNVRADDMIHMNGNDVDCCVRYAFDNNSELEGHFFADIKVALPLRAPTLGLEWNNDIADEDVMGLPNYK